MKIEYGNDPATGKVMQTRTFVIVVRENGTLALKDFRGDQIIHGSVAGLATFLESVAATVRSTYSGIST